jgi:hypothetical protein
MMVNQNAFQRENTTHGSPYENFIFSQFFIFHMIFKIG